MISALRCSWLAFLHVEMSRGGSIIGTSALMRCLSAGG
jgi:hypothetical protein